MKPNWTVFLLIIAVWVLAYLVIERRKKRRSMRGGISIPKPSIKPANSSGLSGFQSLVRSCLGDTAKATRLVQFEQRKNPSLTYAQAISAALDRLSRDRTR